MKGVVQRLGALAAPEGAPASGEVCRRRSVNRLNEYAVHCSPYKPTETLLLAKMLLPRAPQLVT